MKVLFSILSLTLLTNYVFSSVTVIGREETTLCYLAAKAGYSGNISIRTCQKALVDDLLTTKDRSGTQVNLGIVFNNSFLPDKALESFEQAKNFEDLKPEVFLNSGNSYFLKMDFWTAVDYYDRSLEAGLKEQSAAYYNKGLVYEMLGDFKEAISNYKKALKLKPDPVYFEKKRELTVNKKWID